MNATEMAKPFGKRPVDWLRTQQTQDFLKTLTEVRKCTLADLQLVTKEGDRQGPWFIREVALEFTRWLDPKFKITLP